MGFPTSASEELIDSMSLDEYLIGNREATYILHVKSDSMADYGILNGDMVIVERGRTPKHRDIVVAERDGSYLLTPYRSLSSEAIVSAVVTAVIRKYANAYGR